MVGGLVEKSRDIEFEDVNQLFLTHPSEWVQTEVVIEDSINAIWKGVDERGWVLYTDASRSTHGVGWGLAVFKNSFCVYRSSGALSECSIFSAEAYALLQATSYVEASISTVKSETIEIRTDSQGLAGVLEKDYVTDRVLVAIKSKLRKLHFLGKRVLIRWVPSHQDIYGNEVADKLAKKATDNRYQVKMAITSRDLKQFVNMKNRSRRSAAWSGFQSKNIESVQRFIKSKPSISLCQLVSGHTRLNDFVCEKLGLLSSPKCKCQNANETITHFLFECELYDDILKEIWPDFESSYAYILKDWNLLNEFVLKTKRFSKNIREALLVQNAD